jgi:hypothetical protein
MRIVDIRETSVPLNSSLANSSIDFSEMTTSVVAVITDVKRDGEAVAGYASTRPAVTPAARRCAPASSRASSKPSRIHCSTQPPTISTRKKFSPQ